MKLYSFVSITILLTTALESSVSRYINFNESEQYFEVDLIVNNLENLIFATVNDYFPEGWELVPSSQNPLNSTITNHKISWDIPNNAPLPITFSYKVTPSHGNNNTVIFNGTLSGWNQETFEYKEYSNGGLGTLHRLSLNFNKFGTITKSTNSNWILEGESVILEAIPEPQSLFYNWSGDVNGTENPISINVDRPLEISHNYTSHWYINEIKNPHADIIINPLKESYLDGEEVTISIDVPYGFTFSKWNGNRSFQNNNPLTINIDKNIDIGASFEALYWPSYAPRRINRVNENEFEISIVFYPKKNSSVYSIEEHIPEGWEVFNINNSGNLNLEDMSLKWGDFTDDKIRHFSYMIRPTVDINENSYLHGEYSMDGQIKQISGDYTLNLFPGTPNTIVNITNVDSYDHTEGVIFQREISPPNGTTVYAYEESIPEGWTVTDINENGLFDDKNSKIKWGLYFHSGKTIISYKATPTNNWQGSIKPIGLGYFDNNRTNLISQPKIEPNRGSVNTAWEDMPSEFLHTQLITSKIETVPLQGIRTYAVEKYIPEGWKVGYISHEGEFDEINRKIKWGLFTDDTPRDFVYEIQPLFGMFQSNFSKSSFSSDGSSIQINGNSSLSYNELGKWFLTHFRDAPFQSTLNGDLDTDGYSNIFEYAIGSDPKSKSFTEPYYEVYANENSFIYELFIQKNDINITPIVVSSMMNQSGFNDVEYESFNTTNTTRFEFPINQGNLFIKAEIQYDPKP